MSLPSNNAASQVRLAAAVALTVAVLLIVDLTIGALPNPDLGVISPRPNQRLPAGLSLNVIGSRPGTSDVGLTVFELSANSGRIALWSASAGLWTVYHFPAGRSSGRPSFFRVDGSA